MMFGQAVFFPAAWQTLTKQDETWNEQPCHCRGGYHPLETWIIIHVCQFGVVYYAW